MGAADQARPLQHVLRPHHVGILAVFLLVFHPRDSQKLPSRFMLHIHRVLLNEVSEMAQPRSFEELIRDIGNCSTPPPSEAVRLVEALTALPSHLRTVALFNGFFQDLPALWRESDDESAPAPFEARSIFGYFCRRCSVSFNKLSFLGIAKLQENFLAWAGGNSHAGYEEVPKEMLRDDNYILRPHLDRDSYAVADAFGEFEKAKANGDLQSATESLRKFFEQKFNDNLDSEMRQHALLNLVRMHICTGHLVAARKLLREAITVSRTSGDNFVLQQCMSLMRRIEGRTRTRKEPLNELQQDISALEVLNDVCKLLREGQPLNECYEKLIQALAVYDLSRDYKGQPPNLSDQWSFHSVQSVLWRMSGCHKLAEIEENIVLLFCDSGGPDDVRFKALVNKSYWAARRGDETSAFHPLLDPECWRGLEFGLSQILVWSLELWHSMVFFTSRRGQIRQMEQFVKPRKPGNALLSVDYLLPPPDKSPVPPVIESFLYRTLQMRKVDQSVTASEHLLKALWQSEYQGRFGTYRLAIILLADMGLELGMTTSSRRLVEEIMPQVISGDDLELRAFACYVLARCIIATCGNNYEGLRDALPYLQIAEEDYRKIEIQPAVQDVLYVTALVHHNLGDEKERNAVAERHIRSQAESRRLDSVDVNENWEEIWSLTGEISAALASRK